MPKIDLLKQSFGLQTKVVVVDKGHAYQGSVITILQ